MSFYPAAIDERFRSPQRAGKLCSANAEATNASFICGSFVTMFLTIDPETSLIDEASFQTNGCGFMIAAADALCDSLSRRSLSDLRGLREEELSRLIAERLGEFPFERRQCAAVVFEALRGALANYRRSRIEEVPGEQALICTCFGVSEETLIEKITAERITDVDEVGRVCRAGTGCGSCRMLIQELIDARSFDR